MGTFTSPSRRCTASRRGRRCATRTATRSATKSWRSLGRAARASYVQRYKGLGDEPRAALGDGTMNRGEPHRAPGGTLEDAVEAENIFTILMGEGSGAAAPLDRGERPRGREPRRVVKVGRRGSPRGAWRVRLPRSGSAAGPHRGGSRAGPAPGRELRAGEETPAPRAYRARPPGPGAHLGGQAALVSCCKWGLGRRGRAAPALQGPRRDEQRAARGDDGGPERRAPAGDMGD